MRLVGASLGYRGRAVLSDVDVSFLAGGSYGVVGPNGSGKTTLVRTVLGLLRPLSGSIARAPGLVCGYVPQSEQLDAVFPLTVAEVVAMGARRQTARLGRAVVHERVREALRLVGVDALAAERFSRLSGGQRQRVLLARALVGDPDLLVLDEPTKGLDRSARHEIADLLDAQREARGTTLVTVSHDPEIAAFVDEWLSVDAGAVRTGREALDTLAGPPVALL